MKLTSQFNDFLNETVNLNATRVSQLEDSIEAIKSFIRNSDWSPKITDFAAQGSWAHKTIIKPLAGYSFDADLLVYVEPVDGWDAAMYINELYKQFVNSALYKDKVHRYSHCVTIDYVNDRKIDIAPCVRERKSAGIWEVCNRNANSFERSNPLEYTQWLTARNVIGGGNQLRKVTRLLKYMRDIKTNFTCPSFLFTTLLGMQVYDGDSSKFTDTATSLKILVGRLDDWLQARPTIPTVRNPVLYEEIQSGAWDDTKYSNFRTKINLYRGWIDDAYEEADKEESIGKWQRVFGEEFASAEVVARASNVSEAAVSIVRSDPAYAGVTDLVGLVKKMGARALPAGFNRLPHMRRPKWKSVQMAQIPVVITAQTSVKRDSYPRVRLESLQPALPNQAVKFEAKGFQGASLPADSIVMWRVTNTDIVAKREKALRGDFYNSDVPYTRWETLSYRGVHLVEAFLIRKSDEMLIGKSDPFYVVIE